MKAATTSDLVRCAVGAAANAQGLLADAELLSAAARHARAYSLAALAVEEAGKAAGLGTIAMMPAGMRAQAPVGRMLEWHQLKLIGGMLLAALPFGAGAMVARISAMSTSQLERILGAARELAQDVDHLKQRGLYADIDRGGDVQLPSDVTETDANAQLDRARRVVSSASVLLDPAMAARLASPPAEAVSGCRALVSAFSEAGYGRTSQVAADVILKAVRKIHEQALRSTTSDTKAG